MCGIVGYRYFRDLAPSYKERLTRATHTLSSRGPDSKGTYSHKRTGLGQTRLSIIDPSEKGNQPMSDPTGRYTLVFNGEIYNYRELSHLVANHQLQSTSDTEVLLYLLINEGVHCLEKLNGFFSLAFYDKEEDSLLVARDRIGIKPLLYYQDNEKFIFASEMKALFSFPIPRKISNEALYWYLKLNYLPGSLGMIEGVSKLEPGHFLLVKGQKLEKRSFIKDEENHQYKADFETAKNSLVLLLEESVKYRLISDVPLGSFLSGGLDSSAIVALTSRHHSNLSTFSIGYRDHKFFDETNYSELVADKFQTNHTTFSLTNDDLLADLTDIINYIDEPFADSSAIPTYILSKHTRKHVKVALSGDGADELFGGYYKHQALNDSLKSSVKGSLLKLINPLIAQLPQSRSGSLTNLIRRANKYGKMLKMSDHERYWFLASITNDPTNLIVQGPDIEKVRQLKSHFLLEDPDFNQYLDADISILIPGDMLTKVDLMSMANSLEVRVPFLDRNVVSFARSLPAHFKVDGHHRKRIIHEAFKEILPPELYYRPKKGFEVPLLQWLRTDLLKDLDQSLFDSDFLGDQGIFYPDEVMRLRKKLLSNNPGDVHATIWALYIFQKWYSKYIA